MALTIFYQKSYSSSLPNTVAPFLVELLTVEQIKNFLLLRIISKRKFFLRKSRRNLQMRTTYEGLTVF